MSYPESLPQGAELEYNAECQKLDAILYLARLAHTAAHDDTVRRELLEYAQERPREYFPPFDYYLLVQSGSAGSLKFQTSPTQAVDFMPYIRGKVDHSSRKALQAIRINVNIGSGQTLLSSEPADRKQQTIIYEPGHSVQLMHRRGTPWLLPAKVRAKRLAS